VTSNAEETKEFAISMAKSLYKESRVIHLSGDLGTGKTTFIQGFAKGLGLSETVTSPTYALEQLYGNGVLSHIDLYRLTEVEAKNFMETLDECAGIRIIEWLERARRTDADVRVELSDSKNGRCIEVTCNDIVIPSDTVIEQWYEETMIQEHIVRHMRCVADMCEVIADSLEKQKRFVRRKALRAAALCHDLLRFTDFASYDANDEYSVSEEQKTLWTKLKSMYGTPHEHAAEKFLTTRGFPSIGTIVRTHRGKDSGANTLPVTIEQVALMYADKRSLFETRVSVDERFDDFTVRYGGGTESAESKEWRRNVKKAEEFLFPTMNIP
jgi:tRNA threonylcarbamoyladenosine biosynthesis protein TsaE